MVKDLLHHVLRDVPVETGGAVCRSQCAPKLKPTFTRSRLIRS